MCKIIIYYENVPQNYKLYKKSHSNLKKTILAKEKLMFSNHCIMKLVILITLAFHKKFKNYLHPTVYSLYPGDWKTD